MHLGRIGIRGQTGSADVGDARSALYAQHGRALLSSWLGKEVELPVDEDLYVQELNKRIEAEGKFPTIQ